MMRDSNCVAIGWAETGDLSDITNDKAGKDSIRQVLHSKDSHIHPTAAGKAAQQIFNFRWTIATDDLVLASTGATILGIGTVTGEYTYDPTRELPHRRRLDLLSFGHWQQPYQ